MMSDPAQEKDRPTFTLQFDHASSQGDQSTQEATSHEMMSTKADEHSELNTEYSSLKSSEMMNINSKLNYSHTSSQNNNNVPSGNGIDDEQSCNGDEMMSNAPDIHHSEITKYANYSEMLQELGQESKMVLLQYSPVFEDSEIYEQQASQTITDLTAHAQLFLQTLSDHKKILCNRINSISEALKHEG